MPAKKTTPGKPKGKPKNPSRLAGRIQKNPSGSFSAPVARGRAFAGTFNPVIRSSARQGRSRISTIIRSPKEGELISDLLAVSTGAFTTVVNQGVNPGNSFLFPWLSGEAAGFEAYRFKSLCFRYETEAATSQPGTAMLAFDPNAQDAAPTTKQDVMQLAAHCRTPPWQPFRFSVPLAEMDFLGPERYIRLGAVPAGADSKTYDVGQFLMCYSGTSSATNLGELYVDYEVELYGMQPSVASRTSAASRKVTGAVSVTRAAPFGTTPTYTGNLPVTAVNATLTFNSVGTYLLQYEVTGTVMTDTVPTFTGTATASSTTVEQTHNTAATSGAVVVYIIVTAIGQTVIFDFTASATTISASSMRIARWTNAT